MACKNVWARDALLEYRVLHMGASGTLDGMFYGAPNTSVTFITALTGIVLRTYSRSYSAQDKALYQKALLTWPEAIAQINMTLQMQALIEGTSIEQSAHLSKELEISPQGYSTYLVFFGIDIHKLIHNYVGDVDEALVLPELS